MNARTVVALVAALAAAPSALAQYIPYGDLRQDYTSIDAAVAAMPNSSINGSLNKISALFTRSSVIDLAAGAGTAGELPDNFEGLMVNALADLQLDYKDGLATMTLEQTLTMMQVIEVVAVSRNVELYAGSVVTPCTPTCVECPPCTDLRPAILQRLDAFLGGFRSDMNLMIDEYNADPGTTTPLPSYLDSVNSQNLDARLDTIRAAFLTIRGVESIDD